jgi:hypothetical protein
MAVSILQALFLVESWREGAHFDSTLTLGRLGCLMSRRDLKRIARLLPRESEFVRMVERGEVPQYSDELFKAMGATRVDAMDASDFEGATILQDLNEPWYLGCTINSMPLSTRVRSNMSSISP